MSENKNPPVLQIRDRSLSASIFEREHEGKKFYGVCVQRSYKSKNSDEWKREQINLFSDDLLRMASLLQATYRQLIEYAQNTKKQTTSGAEYQAAKDGGWDNQQAQQNDFNDEIPF